MPFIKVRRVYGCFEENHYGISETPYSFRIYGTAAPASGADGAHDAHRCGGRLWVFCRCRLCSSCLYSRQLEQRCTWGSAFTSSRKCWASACRSRSRRESFSFRWLSLWHQDSASVSRPATLAGSSSGAGASRRVWRLSAAMLGKEICSKFQRGLGAPVTPSSILPFSGLHCAPSLPRPGQGFRDPSS